MFRPINTILGWFSHDCGVDLGTSNTLVLVRGKGIVINEPSVVAIDKQSNTILAIGDDAKRMVGRTPENIIAARPLKDGVISDFDTTQQMLQYFFKKIRERYSFRIPRPRVAIGIPKGATEVETKAVEDAALDAGAREVYLIAEPMAAAIGAGLPINEPSGNMIVDIGGGTAEVVVISMGEIVASTSIRIAGDEMDQEIVNYARQTHGLLIGQRTAEEIKIEAGSAFPLDQEVDVLFRGRDLVTGLPKSVTVSSIELRDALAGSISSIVEAVRATIEATPPELVIDLTERGIVLAGGGALLKGLDRRISRETKLPVWVAEDPMTCVARGTSEVLKEIDILGKVAVRPHRKPPKQ